MVMLVATDGETQKVQIENLFKPNQSMPVNLPFVIIFGIHGLFSLREIFITKESRAMRFVEFLLISSFVGFFALEMVSDFKKDTSNWS